MKKIAIVLAALIVTAVFWPQQAEARCWFNGYRWICNHYRAHYTGIRIAITGRTTTVLTGRIITGPMSARPGRSAGDKRGRQRRVSFDPAPIVSGYGVRRFRPRELGGA